MAAMTTWLGEFRLTASVHLAVRRVSTNGAHAIDVQTQNCGDATSTVRHSILHRLRTQAHEFCRIGQEIAPAAHNAVYSPRLCPAKDWRTAACRLPRHAMWRCPPPASMVAY